MNDHVMRKRLGVFCADLDDPAQMREVEAFVSSHPSSTPFHRPAWLLAVAKATGQRPHCLAVRSAAGPILGILPLTEIRSMLFGRALVSSGFAVGGGILADDPVIAEQLANGCWALAQELGCTTVELRGGPAPTDDWTMRSDSYVGFRRALEADDEAQLLAVPKRHRAEIRKGLANNLVFATGRDRHFREAHYKAFAQSVHNLGTPVFPRRLFDEVLEAFGSDADIALVSHEGKVISSALSLYHRGVCMPYWQGASHLSRPLRSNEVLYFTLMGQARERGCTHFDFGRSKVGTGPAAWKKSWGFEPEPLSYHIRTAGGVTARDVNPLSPQYRRKVEMWKKLPLSLANVIGPFISRGLG